MKRYFLIASFVILFTASFIMSAKGTLTVPTTLKQNNIVLSNGLKSFLSTAVKPTVIVKLEYPIISFWGYQHNFNGNIPFPITVKLAVTAFGNPYKAIYYNVGTINSSSDQFTSTFFLPPGTDYIYAETDPFISGVNPQTNKNVYAKLYGDCMLVPNIATQTYTFLLKYANENP